MNGFTKINRVPATLFKFIPSFIVLFCILSPFLYYFGLMHFSGIDKNYNKFFNVIVEKKNFRMEFVDSPPKNWCKLSDVSQYTINAILVSEDWAFFQHSGVDWQQLGIVLKEGAQKLKIKRGASTITQQVVKNLYLTSQKSFLRKFQEILLAFYLEKMTSKKWILEQYLNLAEFDKGIYGIKKAALHYFNKSPSQLNSREGAFLAMLLPNPKKYSVSFYRKELTGFASSQLKRIMSKLVLGKFLTEEKMLAEINTPFFWEQSNQDMMNADEVSAILQNIRMGVEEPQEQKSEDQLDKLEELPTSAEELEVTEQENSEVKLKDQDSSQEYLNE